MYIMKAMICQHLYWPDIIGSVFKEVTNFDTCQRTKRSKKKYGKLQDNLSDETPQNKFCVDFI